MASLKRINDNRQWIIWYVKEKTNDSSHTNKCMAIILSRESISMKSEEIERKICLDLLAYCGVLVHVFIFECITAMDSSCVVCFHRLHTIFHMASISLNFVIQFTCTIIIDFPLDSCILSSWFDIYLFLYIIKCILSTTQIPNLKSVTCFDRPSLRMK